MALVEVEGTGGSPAGDPCAAITYVVSRWGEPTQTFVRREARAVVATGTRVEVLSLQRPRPTHDGIPVTYRAPWRVAVDATAVLLRSPGVALRALWLVASRSRIRNVVPQLVACLIGLGWARSRRDHTLLHAHFGWVAATAAWTYSRITGTPYSLVLHAFELHVERYDDRFAPLPMRAAAAVFVISQHDADLVERRWGVDPRVLHMGVTDEWLTPPLEMDEREANLLVSVGSLVSKKGHHDLLRAVALARRQWRVVIVGDGPEREMLVQLSEFLGLAGRCEFTGLLDQESVMALVRRASVFGLASVVAPDGDRDGIPVALMEAMAAATPVIATAIGGIGELVDGCGLVVAPGEPAGIARALDELEDPARRASLGAAGRRRVEAEFHSSASAATILALARAVTQ